jgi:hypothetical protein
MRAAMQIGWLATAFAAGCAESVPRTEVPTVVPVTQVARPAEVTADEAAAVVRTLRTAQVDYLEGRGTRALFAMHAPELEVRAARSKAPGDKDNVFNGDHLRAIYSWAAHHGVPTTAKVGEPTVERGPEWVSVEWTLRLEHPAEIPDAPPVAFGERYVLERRGGEWRIVRFRYWPLRPETMDEFGAAYFADLDQQIEQTRASGDRRRVAWLLLAAYRFEECAALSRALAEEEPKEPWVWKMRATASAMVGDGEDAEAAMATAARLTATN